MDPWLAAGGAFGLTGLVFFGLLILSAFSEPVKDVGLPVVLTLGVPGLVGGAIGVALAFIVGPSIYAWLNCGPGSFHFQSSEVCFQIGNTCVQFGTSSLIPQGNACDVSNLLVTTIRPEGLALWLTIAFAAGAIALWTPWQLVRGRPVREFASVLAEREAAVRAAQADTVGASGDDD